LARSTRVGHPVPDVAAPAAKVFRISADLGGERWRLRVSSWDCFRFYRTVWLEVGPFESRPRGGHKGHAILVEQALKYDVQHRAIVLKKAIQVIDHRILCIALENRTIAVAVHSLGLSIANEGTIRPAWHGRLRYHNRYGTRHRLNSRRRFSRSLRSTNSTLPSLKHASMILRIGSSSTPPTRPSPRPLIRSG
jgi:hypothetical protein